jgi:hypothetical protein
MGRTTSEAASHIAAAAAWGSPIGETDHALLAAALAVAVANRCERQLVEAAGGRLDDRRARLDAERDRFRRALAATGSLLARAEVSACLIKADPDDDLGYENFDVVVRRADWPRALAALASWSSGTSNHRLERDKRFVHNPDGPDLHLHSRVSWYEVPVIDAESLLDRGVPGPPGFALPTPPDRLRILLAHAAFQTLCLDLRDLRELRELLEPGLVEEARGRADEEGWQRLFEHALAVGRGTVDALDAGRTPSVPAPLSARAALRGGAEHVRRLASGRRSAALREGVLRPLLVAAKLRRGAATW